MRLFKITLLMLGLLYTTFSYSQSSCTFSCSNSDGSSAGTLAITANIGTPDGGGGCSVTFTGIPDNGLNFWEYNYTVNGNASNLNGNFGGSNYFNPCLPSACDLIIGLNNGGTCDAVLPVELISFDVTKQKDGILLQWATATEIENKGFIIEVKKQGEAEFEEIDFVEGNGNSFELNKYEFLFRPSQSGNYYFRLVQEDYNGSLTYSPIKIVQSEIITETKVYPNPSLGREINISILNNAEVSVRDFAGKILHQTEVFAGTNVLALPQLEMGYYIVEITSRQQTEVIKLLVK